MYTSKESYTKPQKYNSFFRSEILNGIITIKEFDSHNSNHITIDRIYSPEKAGKSTIRKKEVWLMNVGNRDTNFEKEAIIFLLANSISTVQNKIDINHKIRACSANMHATNMIGGCNNIIVNPITYKNILPQLDGMVLKRYEFIQTENIDENKLIVNFTPIDETTAQYILAYQPPIQNDIKTTNQFNITNYPEFYYKFINCDTDMTLHKIYTINITV